jgi:hypothetical protein
MIGIYLVHGWMHLFMVQVDYMLFVTGRKLYIHLVFFVFLVEIIF